MSPSKKLEFLPPNKALVETVPVLKQLSLSAQTLGELKGVAKTMPNQAMLINAIVLQEAKDSSEIENIITTQDELYQALTASDKHNPATKEVVNYRAAIFLGAEIIHKQGFLRLNDIIEIQKTIIKNEAGIRTVPGTVLKNDKTLEVVYTPPQEYDQIITLLDNFLTHFNDRDSDVSPLINLAILHSQFESIHPFYDGNGRTGRILNILFLILNDLLDIPILYLSSYINQHKPEYYKFLNNVNKHQEWEPWILFILKAVQQTAKQTIIKINSITQLLNDTLSLVMKQAPKTYRKELVELLFEQPYSKIEYVVKTLGVERKAASRYLRTLESIGILESKKVGRETLYINTKLFQILKAD